MIVEARFGRTFMNAGPEEKAIGGKERIVLRSYIFTRGSGNGRDFLIDMRPLQDRLPKGQPFSQSNGECEIASCIKSLNPICVSFDVILCRPA